MDYFLTRLIFQKALAAVYLIAFLIAFFQFKPLLGSQGLMPVVLFVKKARFKDFPSLFFLCPKDIYFTLGSSLGIILAIVALTGLSEIQGLFFSGAVWFSLWALYLSFVNVGQLFYAFGWEILLLETGFLAVFLGSADTEPPFLIIWLLRLVLFRMMLGAGLIKLRFDKAWKDLTSMVYHYETQPLPGPFSIYFHRLPLLVHKSAALFNHFVELIVPFALLLPAPFCIGASLITAFFQGLLILSGNLSWLNYITLVLCISCFNDTFLESFIPFERPQNIAGLSLPHHTIIYFVTIIILVLNIRPLRNLLSQNQMMNASFDPLHLVNTYGAFGTVTKVRKEIIIEGTDESEITENTLWKPYEFNASLT